MSLILVSNSCAAARIDPRFLPLIDEAVAKLIEIFGEGLLLEVRLQGSVARGHAVIGQSDLDLVALLTDPPQEHHTERLQDLAIELGQRFPIVSRVDLEAIRLEELVPFQRFVLASDSLSVYGTDHLTRRRQWIDRMELAQMVTPDMAVMVPDYRAWIEELAQASNDEELRFASRIVGKDLLKALRSITLLRGGPYEPAIARMHRHVAHYAPEFATLADRLFALYHRPSTEPDLMLTVIDEVEAALLHTSLGRSQAIPPRADAPVTVIALQGPPGTGKSTLARALSQHLSWPLLDKDDLKDVLDGQTPHAGSLSYELLLRLVDRQLRQGLSVVCDSPLLARTYAGLRSIAAATGARLLVVSCHCPDEQVRRQRIDARQGQGLASHHTTTWAGVLRFLAQPEADFPIIDPHLSLDTTQPVSALVSAVVAWLNQLDDDRATNV